MGKAGIELKEEILLALGETPIIQDGILTIEPNEWFAEIENGYPALGRVQNLDLGQFRTREWEQGAQSFNFLGMPQLTVTL